MSSRASFPDLLALGTVFAVRLCGPGIDIPHRIGRVDATAAGPAGVPQPQDTLSSHIANFQKQGFNVTEMIGMVACGHTIGGAHRVDLPNIAPFNPNVSRSHVILSCRNLICIQHSTGSNIDSTIRFDSTFDSYDNAV